MRRWRRIWEGGNPSLHFLLSPRDIILSKPIHKVALTSSRFSVPCSHFRTSTSPQVTHIYRTERSPPPPNGYQYHNRFLFSSHAHPNSLFTHPSLPLHPGSPCTAPPHTTLLIPHFNSPPLRPQNQIFYRTRTTNEPLPLPTPMPKPVPFLDIYPFSYYVTSHSKMGQTVET